MRLTRQGIPSQSPPLHSRSSSLSLNIMEALKLTKSMKSLNMILQLLISTTLMFMRLSITIIFDNDVLFLLAFMAMGVPSAYGRSMDDMDKMCDEHPWCTTMTTNIYNNFGCLFRSFLVLVISNAQMTIGGGG